MILIDNKNVQTSYLGLIPTITLMLMVLFSVTLVACGPDVPNEISETQQIHAPTSQIPEFFTPIATLTHQVKTTPTPPIEQEPPVRGIDIRVLDLDDFSISVQWQISNSLNLDKGMVVLPSDKFLVESKRYRLDFVSWEGIRKELLTVEYLGEGYSDRFRFFSSRLPNSSSRLVVSPMDPEFRDFYILSVSEREAIGIHPGCLSQLEYASDFALGTDYIAFRCNESHHIWHILSIHDGFSVQDVNLLGLIEEPLNYEPKWINPSTLVFEDLFNTGICLTRAPTWDVACSLSSHWVGNVSPSVEFVEVRVGQFELNPDEIGVQNVSCLLSGQLCNPTVMPTFLPDGGYYMLERAVWLQNSQQLLYTVHIESDSSIFGPDETEFWLLDIEAMTVRKVGYYDRMLSFSSLSPPPFPYLWSPDGEWIVVTDARDHYLLSIETGELKPFAEGGYILGPLDLGPITTN
jgi:hypothetical protein